MENSSQKKLEDLVSWMELALRNGNFDLVDSYIWSTSVSDLESPCILAVLNFTLFAKKELKNREYFLKQAETVLKNRLGNERAESLLKNRR